MTITAQHIAEIQAKAAACVARTGALVPDVVVPPPSGEVIAVDAATKYQTMTGWETLFVGWSNNKTANAYDPTWAQHSAAVCARAVNELGIDRLMLPCASGWANPVDYWSQYVAGQLSYLEHGTHSAEATDPTQHQTGAFDLFCDTTLVPMQAAMMARGETLYTVLSVGDWPQANTLYKFCQHPTEYAAFVKFYVDRLASKYGVTLDALNIINEPDGANPPGVYWTGAQIGAALVAVRALMPNLHLIAPSVAHATECVPFATAIDGVPGAMAALDTLSYHIYQSGNYPAIKAFAQTRGKQVAMNEYFHATIDHILDALLLADASSFQKWALAGRLPMNNPQSGYYLAEAANPANVTMAPNTPAMSLLFPYVRIGARRIACTHPSMRVIAFQNANGKLMVHAKRTVTAAQVTITGLTPGIYGVRSAASATATTVTNGADVTVGANGQAALTLAPGYTTIYGR